MSLLGSRGSRPWDCQGDCPRRAVTLCDTQAGKFCLDATYGNIFTVPWTCHITITVPQLCTCHSLPLEHLPLCKNKHFSFFKTQLRTLPEELETLFSVLPLQFSLTVTFSLSVSCISKPLESFFTFVSPEVKNTMPDKQ